MKNFEELHIVLSQYNNITLITLTKDGLYVETANSRTHANDTTKDFHIVTVNDNKYLVDSHFEVLDSDFKPQGGILLSALNRVTTGIVTSSRTLKLHEVADYILQVERIDIAIVGHYMRSQDRHSLDEIAEALIVEYIQKWRPI